MRRLGELTLFAALFYGVILWQGRNMLDSDGSVSIPTQRLPTLAGEVYTLAPEQRQTLVYFFAPWCGICRSSIGHLDAVDPATTRVVTIALDYESREAVQAFVDETGLGYPVLLGTRETGALFQVQAYPTYYVLDSDFRVVDRSMGYMTVLGLNLR